MPYRSLAKRVGNAVRLAELVQILVKHGFADLVRRLGLHEGLPAKMLRGLRILDVQEDIPETLGSRLRAALTQMGPSFIKFGQILSTRPDLIGVSLCQELTLLQDRVDPYPLERMRPVIEASLGVAMEDLFLEFDATPIAAASLSQVYRARLRNHQPVAVKVQRPGIRDVIRSDVSLLRAIAEWIVEHVEDLAWMDPVGTVDEFERSILRELDYAIEARTVDQFNENFKGIETVFVPRIYPDACSMQVLTMDWIDGVRVDAVDEYTARNSTPKTVALNGCDILCRQVFEHHLFHADPHPGNIMLLQRNQIAFLDYGMAGFLEKRDVNALAELLLAVLQKNTRRCVEVIELFTTSGEVEDPLTLEHEVAEYVTFEAQSILGGGQVGRALEHVTYILRRHRLQLSPRFSLLMKALMTIESTGRALDPEMDMVPVMRPYIERIVMQKYAPDNLMNEARLNAENFLRLGKDLPDDLRQLMRKLKRGKLNVHLNHEGLERVAAVTDRASNRVAFSVVTGSLIVGSSLLMSTEQAAQTLGLFGFTIAGLLGFGLLISILRSRNY
ncbi:MAG: ABC transporter [Candidatus Hydrogenedentota bacterium]